MEKTFEEKMEVLKNIVEKIKNPETGLEESVKVYEEGVKLCHELQNTLEKHIRKIEIILSEAETEEEPIIDDYEEDDLE